MAVSQPKNGYECGLICKQMNVPVIIKYSTEWCGPCKGIAPLFYELSQKYMKYKFVEIDIERCEDFEPSRMIKSVPTFEIWYNQKRIDSWTGANRETLSQKIDQLKY